MDLTRLQIDRGPGARRAQRRGGRLGRWFVLAALLGAGWVYRGPLLEQVQRLRHGAVEVELAAVVRSSPAAVAAATGTAANGYIVAQRRAALSADTPGRIVELNVTEGSVVRAGQVVARLYSDEVAASLRGAEAELAAGTAAIVTSRAQVTVARQRLEEAHARVENAEALRDEATAVLDLAVRELKRVSGLIETGGVPRERVDQAEAGVAQTRARLASTESGVATARVAIGSATADIAVAEAALAEVEARIPVLTAARDLAQATFDKTVVRAPFDGVVVLKDAEVGEVVSPNALGGQSRGSVATMVDFKSLEVQVELPETSLASVAEERPVDVFLDAFPGERFEGRVLRIWPTANRQKATIELRIGLATIDPRMRPEMGARVVFRPESAATDTPEVDSTPRLYVPSSAIVRRGEQSGVFVLDGEVARFRAVAPGEAGGRRTSIAEPTDTSGVREGELVVVQPPPSLTDGQRVQRSGA